MTRKEQWESDPRLFPREEAGTGSSPHDQNYSWLLRSNYEDAVAARDYLESWLRDYRQNNNDGRDLYCRFKSKNKLEHFGAFWELYCFHLLRREGFRVESGF